MRFLITGITGFAGTHLTERLLTDGHEVFGTTRAAVDSAPRLRLPAERLLVASLDDEGRMTDIVRQVRPDGMFHLAASSSVAASFSNPEEAYRVNLLGSLSVFSAVQRSGVRCRIVWVGSSDAYGHVNAEELPVTEAQLFRPLSPYGVSKAAADLAAYQWSRAQGLDVVRMRPFNHTGPGQQPHFVCSDFARQLVGVERGQQPARIAVGNLDVARDFSDVRDVVYAYVMAWHRGEKGEAYNVCSGVARTPREILNSLMRLSGVAATIETQPARRRRADIPVLVGSAAKLQHATGWLPAIGWEQTLRDLLQYWRGQTYATNQ